MRPRALALPLLAVCLLMAGCSALGSSEPPELTVQNDDSSQHRVTAYAVEGVDDPTDIGFAATAEDGDRRRLAFSEVRFAGPYRNVTVRNANATSHRVLVAAGANASLSIDSWDRGDLVVFVVETGDPASRLTYVAASECRGPGQSHTITLDADGTVGRTSECG